MKISFMTFACQEWAFDQVLAAAVRHQYHGIEFRCDAKHAHGVEVDASPEARRRFRAQAAGAGIELCVLATSLRFVTDTVLDEAPARIALAHDLGCPALRVFCGSLPPGMTMEQAVEKVGRQLRQAADQAQAAGVQLYLETHDAMCKAVDAVAAVRAANHQAVRVNYDNMHPYRMGETLATTMAALGELVRHSHFHDAVPSATEVQIKPVGEGGLPMDQMIQGLQAKGYRGYLSGEWFAQQYGPTPDDSLARFRQDMVQLLARNNIALG